MYAQKHSAQVAILVMRIVLRFLPFSFDVDGSSNRDAVSDSGSRSAMSTYSPLHIFLMIFAGIGGDSGLIGVGAGVAGVGRATEGMLVLIDDGVMGLGESARVGVDEEEAENRGIVVKMSPGVPPVQDGGGELRC